jgi:thiamine biosynthesis lipoprotein ApbE
VQHFRFPFRAMACENTIELFAHAFEHAESVANAAIDEVRRIEQKYSRYRKDSVLTGINRASRHATSAAWTEIDAETSQLLDFADSCFQQSSGLFDITTGVLRRVWDFKLGHLPSKQAIEELMPLVGWQHVKRRLSSVVRHGRLASATRGSVTPCWRLLRLPAERLPPAVTMSVLWKSTACATAISSTRAADSRR